MILPIGYSELYAERIAPLSEGDRLRFQHHVVTRGETLWQLSEQYGVSIFAISDTNRLNDQHMIHAGHSLIIPLSGIPRPETSVAEVSPRTLGPNRYQIRRGDTLWGIAAKFGIGVDDIKTWNDMSSSLLIAGNTLRLTATQDMPQDSVPTSTAAKRFYSVRAGDTLSQIASSHRTSIDAIRSWNLERDLNIIHPGDEITIYCTTEIIC